MTEAEWAAGTEPAAMLEYLADKASDRKLRLFACACVRRFWGHLRFHTGREGGASDDKHPGRVAVLVAERHAEGEASDAELEQARLNAEASAGMAPEFAVFANQAAWAATQEPAAEAARQAREMARQQAVRDAAYEVPPHMNEARFTAEESARECLLQGQLLHELFGNPFRPVKIDRNWLRFADGAGEAVLQSIRQEHRFDEMPYLCDALMDAGCQDEALLRHLREPTGRHLRGCWALDALLGRE